jgi:hypothetical protein
MEPTVDQDVGLRPWDWLKLLDLVHGQIDFALKGFAFNLANRALAVQVRLKWTAPAKQPGLAKYWLARLLASQILEAGLLDVRWSIHNSHMSSVIPYFSIGIFTPCLRANSIALG